MKRSVTRRVLVGLSLFIAGCSEITPSPDQRDAVSPLGRDPSPGFIQLSSYTVFTDVGGANDIAGSADLSQFGIDNSSNATYGVFWNWDATDQWTGIGQTGDACALFDTDADGFVNFAICAQIANGTDASQIVLTTGSPWVFTCSDASNNRCTNPSAPLTYSASDIQAITEITSTDPFANLNPDQNWPSDATIELVILKSFLPAAAVAINVCSYPSATNGGNNNPFDCVLAPPNPVARLDLVVTSATTAITQAGQVVDYNYLVTNTGALAVSNVTVADQLVSMITCPQTSLTVNESMTCTGSHTVTVSEMSGGDSLVSAATVDSDETQPFAYRLSIPILSTGTLALIVDPRTSCRAYTASTANSIDSVTYALKNALVSQLSYRSVVYYATLSAPSAEFSAVVTQGNGSGWQPLRVETRSIAIYDADCRKPAARQVASFNSTTGEATILVTGATQGATYYIGVEYVLSDLLRKAVISPSAKFSIASNLGGVPIAATQRDLNIVPR